MKHDFLDSSSPVLTLRVQLDVQLALVYAVCCVLCAVCCVLCAVLRPRVRSYLLAVLYAHTAAREYDGIKQPQRIPHPHFRNQRCGKV